MCSSDLRVSVPRREIDSELHSILIAGFPEFFHNVSLSVLPRRRGYGMFGGGRRPKAESIVVFRRQKHHFKSGIFKAAHPLFGIQFRRVEKCRIFFSVSPFVPGYDRYDFGLGEENIESYRFGGESKPGDDRGAVSGIGIFRD